MYFPARQVLDDKSNSGSKPASPKAGAKSASPKAAGSPKKDGSPKRDGSPAPASPKNAKDGKDGSPKAGSKEGSPKVGGALELALGNVDFVGERRVLDVELCIFIVHESFRNFIFRPGRQPRSEEPVAQREEAEEPNQEPQERGGIASISRL